MYAVLLQLLLSVDSSTLSNDVTAELHNQHVTLPALSFAGAKALTETTSRCSLTMSRCKLAVQGLEGAPAIPGLLH
jgi:hypothetical protein